MENRRDFFRLQVYNVDMEMELAGLSYEGRVKDLSGSGISFYLDDEVEFERALVRFSLDKASFQEPIRLIRTTVAKNGEKLYACNFTAIEEKTQSRILSVLLRWDAIRRKR